MCSETALLLEPEKRAAYLAEVCADNLELRRAVEHLLDQDAKAGSFLSIHLSISLMLRSCVLPVRSIPPIRSARL